MQIPLVKKRLLLVEHHWLMRASLWQWGYSLKPQVLIQWLLGPMQILQVKKQLLLVGHRFLQEMVQLLWVGRH